MTPTGASQVSVSPPAIAVLAARERHALVAALTFLDRAFDRSLDLGALDAWIQRYLVGTGWMPWPRAVSERRAGAVALGSTAPVAPDIAARLEAIIQEARASVVITLRGFIAPVCDERFLDEAILGERVAVDSRGMMAGWVPRPRVDDPLSEIVLSLFAADILANRETYDHALGVCALCGRVGFDPSGHERARCPTHG